MRHKVDHGCEFMSLLKISKPQIRFITFGNFDILADEKSLLTTVKNSSKLIALLKFFITNKQKKLLPETILDNLGPDLDLQNPKNALRTQIYRLRQLLTKMQTQNCLPPFCRLNFQNGFYEFIIFENSTLDAEEFSAGIQKGNELKDSDPREAVFYYQRALNIYRGDFLAEDLYSEWVIPIRNRYHRLYVWALLQQLELLKILGEYEEIVETCEKAFTIESDEELVHIAYLEALLELALFKQATIHYKYVTEKLAGDLGVKPSSALREIGRELKSKSLPKHKNGLSDLEILNELQEKDPQTTAFYCNIEEFQTIYNLEERKSSRNPASSFLGIITLNSEISSNQQWNCQQVMRKVRNTLLLTLRKGDVLTQWSNDTLLFILSSPSPAKLKNISIRINEVFKRKYPELNIPIDIKFYPLGKKTAGKIDNYHPSSLIVGNTWL
ncbi:MAG: bacterial transcriptional activator domain-containing protein [Desulfitobacteriia bacterium]